jgi:hypothetical protein
VGNFPFCTDSTYIAQTVALDAGDRSHRFHLTPLRFQYLVAQHLKLASCYRYRSYLQAYMLVIAHFARQSVQPGSACSRYSRGAIH